MQTETQRPSLLFTQLCCAVLPDVAGDERTCLMSSLRAGGCSSIHSALSPPDHPQPRLTHAITTGDVPEDTRQRLLPLLDSAAVIRPQWVYASLAYDLLLPTSSYAAIAPARKPAVAPRPLPLFSGLVIAVVPDLPADQRAMLWATILFHGGECVSGATRRCTHILWPPDRSCVLDSATRLDAFIVGPDWVFQCVRDQARAAEDGFRAHVVRPQAPATAPDAIASRARARSISFRADGAGQADDAAMIAVTSAVLRGCSFYVDMADSALKLATEKTLIANSACVLKVSMRSARCASRLRHPCVLGLTRGRRRRIIR